MALQIDCACFVDPVCVEKGAYELINSLQDELIKQGLVDEVQILETARIGDPQLFTI